jgi:hypothetical protein
MSQPYVYIGVFLEPSERKRLLNLFPAKHKNIFADHITLAYKPTPEDVGRYELGKEISFSVIGEASDAKGHAVVTDINVGENEISHITISTSEDTKPVYSNELLKRGHKKIAPVVFRGKIGAWDSFSVVFGKESPRPCKKIIIPTRPQSDTIVAIFILKTFGRESYPGIEAAPIEVSSGIPEGETFQTLLEKGTLALDLGGGDLDHHNREPAITCSELVSLKLGVKDDPALAKLLEYARRDDIVGKGTVSNDALDRAFGLSGLITAMNKTRPNDATGIVHDVLPLIAAHYMEELKRTKELPLELDMLMKSGKTEVLEIRQRDKKLKTILLESDNTSMPGYLRSQIGGRFDVVVQRMTTGHTNILTRPTKRPDLRSLALVIRLEEANQMRVELSSDARYLSQPGRIKEITNWYYDDATNSIQNGGANPKDTMPTRIDSFVMRKLIEAGLSETVWSPMRR